MNGIVRAICIAPVAGQPMQEVDGVEAIGGRGLNGDRYCNAKGSFSGDKPGNRQVTLMNTIFFKGSGFKFKDSRRNLFVEGVELMWLVGREFQIGTARFRGVKYCDPCGRPTKLLQRKKGVRGILQRISWFVFGKPNFKKEFQDCGGLIAEVIESGIIRVGDFVIPPPKEY